MNDQTSTSHSDDVAIDTFAAAMKAKMAAARAKGRSGWQTAGADHLSALLRGHVEKGDPVDVANFAMMLQQTGNGIAPAAKPLPITGNLVGLACDLRDAAVYANLEASTLLDRAAQAIDELTELIWPTDVTFAAPASRATVVPDEMVQMPAARDVGRYGDMSPDAFMRVGLDNDSDVYVSVWSDHAGGDVEFCTPAMGGGKSPHTREALIALMRAMEADNAETPNHDWWARRNSRKPCVEPMQFPESLTWSVEFRSRAEYCQCVRMPAEMVDSGIPRKAAGG